MFRFFVRILHSVNKLYKMMSAWMKKKRSIVTVMRFTVVQFPIPFTQWVSHGYGSPPHSDRVSS